MKKLLVICVLLNIQYSYGVHKPDYFFQMIPETIRVEQLYAQPLIFLLHNFISPQEVNHVKKIVQPRLCRSLIGENQESSYRTSSSTELPYNEDTIIKMIAQRAAKMVGYPASHVELQVVRYQKEQQYKQHWDYYPDDIVKRVGSQRIYTFFVYLSDVPDSAQGGTYFPKLKLTIQPQKYTAAVWRNVNAAQKTDEYTLHAGLPLKTGEKWGMNIWIHDKPYTFTS